MGYFIVKPDRTANFYTLWSTEINDVIAAGTAEEIAEWLATLAREQAERTARGLVSRLIPLASACGTSNSMQEGGYDAPYLVVGGCHRIKRELLAQYATLITRGQTEEAEELLEPWSPEGD